MSSSLELWVTVSSESGTKSRDYSSLNSRIYCHTRAKVLSSFSNQGAQTKLSLPTPQGIPVLLSEHQAKHWQKRELHAWQLKDQEREMMCNKSDMRKAITAGHITLTPLGIASTLMIFQHVMVLNHDDTGAGSTYQPDAK